MSEIKNGRLVFYGAEHSKCNHMMTLGFKGLTKQATPWFGTPFTTSSQGTEQVLFLLLRSGAHMAHAFMNYGPHLS